RPAVARSAGPWMPLSSWVPSPPPPSPPDPFAPAHCVGTSTARRIGPALALIATLGLASAARGEISNQVPIGARAIGMGGAFSALADDASALFWNPAGLARVGHQEIGASHANLYDTGIHDDVVSFVLPFSADRATALDWYHSGFDDGTLGFAENRVTL